MSILSLILLCRQATLIIDELSGNISVSYLVREVQIWSLILLSSLPDLTLDGSKGEWSTDFDRTKLAALNRATDCVYDGNSSRENSGKQWFYFSSPNSDALREFVELARVNA